MKRQRPVRWRYVPNYLDTDLVYHCSVSRLTLLTFGVSQLYTWVVEHRKSFNGLQCTVWVFPFMFLPLLSHLLYWPAYINGIPNIALMVVSFFMAILTLRRCLSGDVAIVFPTPAHTLGFLLISRSRVTNHNCKEAQRLFFMPTNVGGGESSEASRAGEHPPTRHGNSFLPAQVIKWRHSEERLASSGKLEHPPTHSLACLPLARTH